MRRWKDTRQEMRGEERKGKEGKEIGTEEKQSGKGESRGKGNMSKSSCLVNGIGTHANGFIRLAWTNADLPH